MIKKFLAQRERLGILVLIIAFGFLYVAWSINKHNHFQTDAIDLGLFDHTLWLYSTFNYPFFNYLKGINLLGDHSHIILIFLTPFYWLWNDARTLLLLQGIIAVLGAIPVYLLAKEKFGSKFFSLTLSFVYLSFVGLQTALDYDFHEIVIGTTLLSFMYYFYFKKHILLFFVFAVLAIITKENLPLYVAFFGLYLILIKRDFRVGIPTFFLGGFSYWFLTNLFIPYFKKGPFNYEHLPKELGVTSKDLVITSLTRPHLVLKTFFFPELKIKTMANLFAAYSFLPLLSPFTYFAYLPVMAERFLNELTQRWLIRYQYSVTSDPIFAFGTILGLSNLINFINKILRLEKKVVLTLVSILLISSNIFVLYRTNAPIWRMLNLANYKHDSRFDLNYQMIRMIPPEARVQAQSSFVPHLDHRKKIDRYPSWPEKNLPPEYIIMSADESSDPPYPKEELQKRIETLRTNPDYETIFWDGTRLLLKLKSTEK